MLRNQIRNQLRNLCSILNNIHLGVPMMLETLPDAASLAMAGRVSAMSAAQ